MKNMPNMRLVRFVIFLLFVTPAANSLFAADAPFGENVQLRGSLAYCRGQFLTERKGTVAFLGGSITEMNGYRPMVCDILKKRFPQTDFKFTNAGISSTCSTTVRLSAGVGCGTSRFAVCRIRRQ